MNPSDASVTTEDAEARSSRPVRKKFWQNDMEAVLGIMAVLIILGMVTLVLVPFCQVKVAGVQSCMLVE